MGSSASAPEDITVSCALAQMPPTRARAGEDRVLLTNSELGRYLIIDRLTRPGSAAESQRDDGRAIMRAYDPRLQREVALQLVRIDTISERAQAALLRQAQTMGKLSHPNVVAVYDAMVTGEYVLMAMEYVRGTTLEQWLGERRPWDEVLKHFIAAGRGLAASHKADILHRNFEPSKVLLGVDGRVRVTDFQIATVDEAPKKNASTVEVSSSGPELLNTLESYTAPEQYDGAELSPASDQYAFCAALWEGLTGKPPFVATQDALADVSRKRAGPPAWPKSVAVPAAIRNAVSRGLASQPEQRWPDMEALLAALVHDPRKLRNRWLLAVCVPTALAGGVIAWSTHREALAQRCSGAELQLAGVWNASRRDDVQQALLATEVVYARHLSQQIAAALDAYASAWVSTHRGACEATTVRGEQPPAVMDLKMACLQRAKVDLNAAVDLLTRADAPMMENIHRVVGALPSVRRCDDPDALMAEVSPPDDADRDAVELVRSELAAARSLRQAGKVSEALTQLQPVAERAASIPYPPIQTEVMLELGLTKEATDTADTEAQLRRALRSALSHRQWPQAVAAATQLLAVIGIQEKRPLEALAFAQTANGLLELVDAAAEAELRSHIGGTLDVLARYTEAEAEHRRAVALAEEDDGDAVSTGVYRSRIGLNLQNQGRHAEAEREQEACIAALEPKLGPDHPAVSGARFVLADIVQRQGRYAEAEALSRTVLEAWKRVYGPDHPVTATARGALSNALFSQHRFEEALHEQREVMRVQIATFGPTHARVSMSHNSLGTQLAAVGRYAEAEAHMRQALAIDEKIYGLSHPVVGRTRAYLAEILVQEGRRPLQIEAEARKALEILKAAVGDDAPDLCYVHRALAVALRTQGRYDEAEVEGRAALRHARRVYGPEHADVAAYHNLLGVVLEAQGRHAEAEAEHRRALQLQAPFAGTDPTSAALMRGQLAQVIAAQGRHAEAQREYRRALALHDAVAPGEHPRIAALQANLGHSLLRDGGAVEALELLERAWATWKDDTRVSAAVRASIGSGLARAIRETGGDRERSRSLAQVARQLRLSAGTKHGR